MPSGVVDTVKTTTGWYTAFGSLGTFIVVMGTVITCYIKFGSRWKEIVVGERKSEYDAMTARIAALEKKIDNASKDVEDAKDAARSAERKAEDRVHKVELQLRSALNACRILLNYVEREHPDASEVSLAKELLAIAVTDDMGISSGFDRIVGKMAEKS